MKTIRLRALVGCGEQYEERVIDIPRATLKAMGLIPARRRKTRAKRKKK